MGAAAAERAAAPAVLGPPVLGGRWSYALPFFLALFLQTAVSFAITDPCEPGLLCSDWLYDAGYKAAELLGPPCGAPY